MATDADATNADRRSAEPDATTVHVEPIKLWTGNKRLPTKMKNSF